MPYDLLKSSSFKYACSAFCLEQNNKPIFGRNYDFDVGEGLVFVNKRSVSKVAIDEPHPVRWTSKYGSVTFNQMGREFPMGGMNEAGLVVESLTLQEETTYPIPDSRPSIFNLQWIQYQLDSHGTTAEVIASDAFLRISQEAPVKLHYFVCDRSGECASIEFIDGTMVCHTKGSLPIKALTNSTYVQSVQTLNDPEKFTIPSLPPDDASSLSRFYRIAKGLDNPHLEQNAEIDSAFDLLAKVAQGDYTKWSIVYDVLSHRIFFHTLRNPDVREIDMESFDYSSNSPVQLLDMNACFSGNVSNQFEKYTRQINRDFLGRVFRQIDFLANTPDQMIDEVANYPESTVPCGIK